MRCDDDTPAGGRTVASPSPQLLTLNVGGSNDQDNWENNNIEQAIFISASINLQDRFNNNINATTKQFYTKKSFFFSLKRLR